MMQTQLGAQLNAEPFLGSRNVTMDWCEENYVLSPYVAEFWNTLSAALTVTPALLWFSVPNPPGAEFLAYLHLNVAVIQVGSTLFHGTLAWFGQLLDEIPLLVLSCASICITLDTFTLSGAGARPAETQENDVKSGKITPTSKILCSRAMIRLPAASSDTSSDAKLATKKSRRVWWAPGPRLLTLLGALQVLLTVYLYVFHAKFYQTFLVVVLVQAAMHWPLILSELFGRLREERVLRKLVALHVGTGYGGFALWSLENLLCERLNSLKFNSYYSYSSFPGLHALWHFLAIAGLKYWHDFLVVYRLSVLGRRPVYRPALLGMGRSVFTEIKGE